jgi:NitT/TauT family transport system substrate-binding protein
VSHYLLARALGNSGLSLSDVKTVNTSDADIVGAFSSPDAQAAVAWNPQLSVMRAQPGQPGVFLGADSGRNPRSAGGRYRHAQGQPALGKALAGIWYETMALMKRQDEQGKAARAAMAKLAGTTRRCSTAS